MSKITLIYEGMGECTPSNRARLEKKILVQLNDSSNYTRVELLNEFAAFLGSAGFFFEPGERVVIQCKIDDTDMSFEDRLDYVKNR